MSDSRNAMLSLLADAQKQMHQRRVQGVLRTAAPAAGALTTTTTARPARGAAPSTALTTVPSTTEGTVATLGGRVRSATYVGARDHRGDFFDLWSHRIEAFVNDSTQTTMDLPDELDSNDRRVLHSLAEKFNLAHSSVGKGTGRHLVLKKDELFYRAANKVVDRDAIAALKQKDETPSGSRFHLKRIRKEGGGSAADSIFGPDDEDEEGGVDSAKKQERIRVEKALRALENATNQYAFATDLGGAPQIAAAGPNAPPHHRPMTPGESEANRFLSSRNTAAPSAAAASSVAQRAAPPPPAAVTVPSAWANAMAEHKTAAAGARPNTSNNNANAAVLKDVVTYEEQCTGCGTSSALDYEVDQWTCIGQCDACGREAVFRLVERRRRVVVAATPPPAAEEPHSGAAQKRPREEEAGDASGVAAEAASRRAESIEKEADAPSVVPAVVQREEITKDDDDDEEEEVFPMEVDDLVSMLECNDYSPALVGWLRGYATGPLGGDSGAIGAQIQLVMELSDVPKRLPSASPTASSSNASSSSQQRLFCKLTSDGETVAALLEEAWKSAFSGSAALVVGLPNMSVAGVDVELVVHGPRGEGAEAALAAMKTRVGSNRLVYGTTLASVL